MDSNDAKRTMDGNDAKRAMDGNNAKRAEFPRSLFTSLSNPNLTPSPPHQPRPMQIANENLTWSFLNGLKVAIRDIAAGGAWNLPQNVVVSLKG